MLLCLLAGFTSAAADDNTKMLAFLNFFNNGQYTEAQRIPGGNLLDPYTTEFLEGWDMIQQGKWSEAQTHFLNLSEMVKPDFLSGLTETRAENIIAFIQACSYQASGATVNALTAFRNVHRDEHADVGESESMLLNAFIENGQQLNTINDIYAHAQVQIEVLCGLIYEEGTAAYRSNDLDKAVELFGSLEEYKDSAALLAKWSSLRAQYEDQLEKAANDLDHALQSNNKAMLVETIESLEKINGFRNSGSLLEYAQSQHRLMLHELSRLKAVPTDDMDLLITWESTVEVSQYTVTVEQAGVSGNILELETGECSCLIKDILPNAQYNITIRVKNNVYAKELTGSARIKEFPKYQADWIGSPVLGSYLKKDLKEFGVERLLLGDGLQKLGRTIELSHKSVAKGDTGYLMDIQFVAPAMEKEQEVELTLLIRVGTAVYGHRIMISLPAETNVYRIYAGLDDLLDCLYTANGKWQDQSAIIEMYIDDQFLTDIQIRISAKS